MLKSLFPQIEWQTVKIVGFDLDGTLYDEAEFIAQVHHPISKYIASRCGGDADTIRTNLFSRWLEKGSSYSKLFTDILYENRIFGTDAKDSIKDCVQIFREFKPNLTLPIRTKAILRYFSNLYPLFLITDGSSALQTSKFESLGLEEWFQKSNVGISGDYGPDFQKPSTKILEKIEILNNSALSSEIVYFGDREVDQKFASLAGFRFVKVHCLKSVCTSSI